MNVSLDGVPGSDVERPAVRASEVIDGVVTAVAAVDMLDFEF